MVARVDPFEAPDPEPQPFVEQLKAEQQDSAAAGAQSGFMAALRRSISGAGSNSRRTPRQSAEGAAWANAQLAPRQSQHIAYLQQQQQQQEQQQQQQSEGGANMQFLDLDATRAYALGVHQVMMRLEQGMQSLHSQSEASSKPASPRTSCFAEAAAAAVAAAEIAAAAGEVDAVNEQVNEDQLPSAQPSQQQLDAEDSDDARQQQQFHSARETGTDSGPLSAGLSRADISDVAMVPPLRSGMSSPAASRHQTLVTGPPAAARQLPLMGQTSLEILGKQQQQGLTASRQTSLVGASTAVSLAEVYRQTSGNLAPLSSHLSGVGRRSSR
jgi:hypothetical protein